MNAQIVRNTLLPLDGKEFSDRESLEDAVFPYFGSLTSLFGGEGHRDMVDRLLSARWVVIEDNKFKVRFPSFDPIDKPAARAKAPVELTYPQLQLILTIGDRKDGLAASTLLTFEDESTIKSLIDLAFVEVIDTTPTRERELSQRIFDTSLARAHVAIKEQSWYEAIAALDEVAKANEKLKKIEFAYRLTAAGEDVRANLKTAKVKV